uniref:Methyltransferase type 11 domain-containing protein n=1 Tax=viral metagenome TaxID=1070528 RepID=A0A6C0EDA5_9ZZZZ
MDIEKIHVQDVYEHISEHFDLTRYKQWKCVREFLSKIPDDELIYEAGCGNGKNMSKPNMYGSDICLNFVELCKSKGLNVKHNDICHLEEKDDTYDATMCIAVVHHLATRERRIEAIKELCRITKPTKPILIAVWSHEYNKDDNQDRMISWQKQDGTKYDRYYHYFTKDELEDIYKEIGVNIETIYEECGNWISIISKSS